VTLLSGSTSGLTDGAGTTARFNAPLGVAVTAAGEVYVADTGNSAIRRVAADGVTSTVSSLTIWPATPMALPRARGLPRK